MIGILPGFIALIFGFKRIALMTEAVNLKNYKRKKKDKKGEKRFFFLREPKVL